MKTITAGSLPKRNLVTDLLLVRWLKKSTLIEIIVILYMSMFLYTAFSKWSDYTMTREQMALMPALEPIAHIVVWLLPATEIVITLLMFLDQTRKTGLYAATILMILFTIYIIFMMLFFPNLPCSCGGFLTELSWPGHLVFNGSFIALGILAIRMLNKSNTNPQ
jgi:uncharacterized membrane protein YphA (DoxX/SURF4 family)